MSLAVQYEPSLENYFMKNLISFEKAQKIPNSCLRLGCWCVTSSRHGLISRRCTCTPSHTLPPDETRCGSLQVYASGADADETRALAAADAPSAGSKGATTAAPAAASAGPRPLKCDVLVFAAQIWVLLPSSGRSVRLCLSISARPFDFSARPSISVPDHSISTRGDLHSQFGDSPSHTPQMGAAAGGHRLPAAAAAGRPAADGRRYRRPRAGGPRRAPLGEKGAQDAGVAARGGRARRGRQVMSAM